MQKDNDNLKQDFIDAWKRIKMEEEMEAHSEI